MPKGRYVTPEQVTRLDHTKSRIIIAVMNNMNDKKKVLSKVKEIRNSTKEKYKRVVIRPDLTPRQRPTSKHLLAQLKRRREDNLNKIYTIYRTEIVEIQ